MATRITKMIQRRYNKDGYCRSIAGSLWPTFVERQAAILADYEVFRHTDASTVNAVNIAIDEVWYRKLYNISGHFV